MGSAVRWQGGQRARGSAATDGAGGVGDSRRPGCGTGGDADGQLFWPIAQSGVCAVSRLTVLNVAVLYITGWRMAVSRGVPTRLSARNARSQRSSAESPPIMYMMYLIDHRKSPLGPSLPCAAWRESGALRPTGAGHAQSPPLRQSCSQPPQAAARLPQPGAAGMVLPKLTQDGRSRMLVKAPLGWGGWSKPLR